MTTTKMLHGSEPRLRHACRVPFWMYVSPEWSSLVVPSSSSSQMLPEMMYPKSMLSLVCIPGLAGSMC